VRCAADVALEWADCGGAGVRLARVSAAGSGPIAPLRIQCESVCGCSGTGRYTHPIVEATTAWDALMHAGRFWMNSLSALFSKKCSAARCRPPSAWQLPYFGAAGLSALLTALTACTPTADTATNRADLAPVARQVQSAPAPSQPLDAATLQQRLVAYAASLRTQPRCVRPPMLRRMRSPRP